MKIRGAAIVWTASECPVLDLSCTVLTTTLVCRRMTQRELHCYKLTVVEVVGKKFHDAFTQFDTIRMKVWRTDGRTDRIIDATLKSVMLTLQKVTDRARERKQYDGLMASWTEW